MAGKFKMCSKTVTLTLIDASTNEEYTLHLNPDDHRRALNDMTFASTLLKHAICNKTRKRPFQGSIEREKKVFVSDDSGNSSTNPQPTIEIATSSSVYIPGSGVQLNDDAVAHVSGDPVEIDSDPVSDTTGNDCSENVEDNVGEFSGRWSDEAILLLLDSYDSKSELLTKGKIKPKTFWDKIATLVNAKGYNVTGTQCRTKLATLKRYYKKIKDHNNTSGNERKDWMYTEKMDELFGNKPWIEPLATASSSVETVTINLPEMNAASTPTAERPRLAAQGLQRTANRKVVDVLAKIRDDRQRHHEEKMNQQSQAINLLKSLIDKLDK